ncbi:MAG: hypothetical protein ACOC80_16975, partial [Petrotogales bacterium]
MEKLKLTPKIRVVINPNKLKNCPGNRLQFYTNYASTVSETLRKPIFQKFLEWLTKREKIKKGKVKDIQVRVFPFQKENGKFVAGRCKSNDGTI